MPSGNVSVTIRLAGENRASSVVRAVEQDLRGLEAGAAKAGGGVTVAFAAAKESFLDLTAKVGMASMAIRAGIDLIKQLGESASEGAKFGDQVAILEKNVEGYGQVVEDVQTATTGLLSEGAIAKAAAMFDAFGMDITQLDEALGEVAKTSIRTGESIEMLTDSLVTGIARESAMRLDNLGVIVKVEEATARAAATTGKATDALTAQERKAALLQIVLERLADANRNVSLSGQSQAASLQRVSAAWDDYVMTGKRFLADVAVGVVDFFTGSERAARAHRSAIYDVGAAMQDTERVYSQAISAMTADTREFTGALVDAQRKAAWAARTDAKAAEIRRAEAERAAARVDAELQVARRNIYRKAVDEAQAESTFRAEAARITARITAEEAATSAQLIDQMREEELIRQQKLEDAESALFVARGETDERRELRRVEAEIVQARADGNVELEASLTIQQASLIAMEKAGRGSGGRGGGRSDSPRGLTPDDLRRMEAAQLRVWVQTKDIAQEELGLLEAGLWYRTEAAKLAEEKLTEEARGVRAKTLELELVEKLNTLAISEADAARTAAEQHERSLAAMRAALGLDQRTREQDIGEAFKAGAIDVEEKRALLAEEADQKEQELHDRRIERIGAWSGAIRDASSMALNSTDPVIRRMGEITNAVGANMEALVSGTDASISAMGRVAAAFFDNEVAKAAVLAVSEAAAAIAAFAEEDYVAGALHAAAAVMYAAVAGTSAANSAAGKRGKGSSQTRERVSTPFTRDERGNTGAVVFNLNAPGSWIGGDMQEAGAQMARWSRAGEGTGMGRAA